MDTRVYPGSGKRRPYVQQGGESLYYLAPKCLYRGEYKKDLMRVLSPRRGVVSAIIVLCILLAFSSASASPFIVQGEAQGYRA